MVLQAAAIQDARGAGRRLPDFGGVAGKAAAVSERSARALLGLGAGLEIESFHPLCERQHQANGYGEEDQQRGTPLQDGEDSNGSREQVFQDAPQTGMGLDREGWGVTLMHGELRDDDCKALMVAVYLEAGEGSAKGT